MSVSTVQSHSKSIYRKLGIHRKDELIEMVEALKNPGSDTPSELVER